MRLLRLVPLALVAATAAGAQQTVMDDATFVITRNGAPYGTEVFRIVRRTGTTGVEYVASCTRSVDGQMIRTTLTVDSLGSPVSYARSTTGASAGQLAAQRVPGRLVVEETGGRASTKDYLAGTQTLIIEDDLLHQLYFAAWKPATAAVSWVAPAGRNHAEAALADLGPSTVVIDGRTLPARHLSLGAGAGRREIWVDSARRLLKVVIPAQRLEGIRELPPR